MSDSEIYYNQRKKKKRRSQEESKRRKKTASQYQLERQAIHAHHHYGNHLGPAGGRAFPPTLCKTGRLAGDENRWRIVRRAISTHTGKSPQMVEDTGIGRL